MTRFHTLFLELYYLLVHIVITTSWNTDFKFHSFERFIRFKLCWSFVQLLDSFHFDLFYLDLGDCSDESVSDAFVGLPYDLKVIPYFAQEFNVFPEVFEFLHVAWFQAEQFLGFAASGIVLPDIINPCV